MKPEEWATSFVILWAYRLLCRSSFVTAFIQSDLFLSLNSSWPSYWSWLQPLLASFPPFCSFLHFHMYILFPSNFLLIDRQSFYSPTHLLSLGKCVVMMSVLLSAHWPSLPPHFVSGLFWLARSLFIKRLLVISTSSSLLSSHQPNNHVFLNLFFGAWDKNGVRPVLEGFQTLWLQRDLAWAGECDDGNPVVENILSKQACGITVSQSGLKGKLFHLYSLIFQLRQFAIFTRLGGNPQGLDFFFSILSTKCKVFLARAVFAGHAPEA